MAKSQSKLKKWGFRILKVLGILILLYLIIGIVAPSDYEVERERNDGE